MEDKKMYDNCISLGWSCSTAASMAKHGFRSFSGPFDWYLSDFEPVLGQIEHGFSDFLNMDNLVVNPNDPKKITDTKYGFVFPHEIVSDLQNDYKDIVEKYNRRIGRFYEQIKSPTIFLRAVRSEEEKDFISDNYFDIENTVRKHNPDNVIIYLLPIKMGKLPSQIKQFTLNIEAYLFDPGLIRDTFDDSPDLLQFLNDSLRSDSVKLNKSYDVTMNEAAAATIYNMIMNGDEGIAKGIKKLMRVKDEEGIYLWGAGHHGTALCRYLESQGVRINGIIDSQRGGSECCGHMVMSAQDLTGIDRVFISVADRKAVFSVKHQIRDIDPGIVCGDYHDLFTCIND